MQDFRNGSGAFLAVFLSKMTYLGELNTVIVIMAVIYWSVSKVNRNRNARKENGIGEKRD